ncbi:hypothetical protein ACMXYN_14625 [Neptuniibacter sp. PT8_73]
MTESFIRQRRNLYIVNGILLFSCLAKVQISNLTVAGINFSGFNNPQIFFVFLWIVWIYFLYRFAVYFLEDERDSFIKTWEREIQRYVNPKLHQIAEGYCSNEYLGNSGNFYSLKKNGWKLNFQEGCDHEHLGQQISNHSLHIRYSQLAVPLTLGALRFLLLTPAVTNYILPILFSFVVFYVAGFTSWEGALNSNIN